jgi:hypothetical protein
MAISRTMRHHPESERTNPKALAMTFSAGPRVTLTSYVWIDPYRERCEQTQLASVAINALPPRLGLLCHFGRGDVPEILSARAAEADAEGKTCARVSIELAFDEPQSRVVDAATLAAWSDAPAGQRTPRILDLKRLRPDGDAYLMDVFADELSQVASRHRHLNDIVSECPSVLDSIIVHPMFSHVSFILFRPDVPGRPAGGPIRKTTVAALYRPTSPVRVVCDQPHVDPAINWDALVPAETATAIAR